MRHTFIYIVPMVLALCLGACRGGSGNSPSPVAANTFTRAILTSYGHYYDSLPLNVYSLDLYSEGLTLDEDERMQGSGTNLYFSDIFIPLDSTRLPAGTYRCNSVPDTLTFLPGQWFDINVSGAYLLVVEEETPFSVTLLTDSIFTLRYEENDTIALMFTLTRENGRVYKGAYRGVPERRNLARKKQRRL